MDSVGDFGPRGKKGMARVDLTSFKTNEFGVSLGLIFADNLGNREVAVRFTLVLALGIYGQACLILHSCC